MTCAVAYREASPDGRKRTITVAADSACFDGDVVMGRKDPKVFWLQRPAPPIVAAFCGSFRAGQVVRQHFKPKLPVDDLDLMHYLVFNWMEDEFVTNLRYTLDSHGCLVEDAGCKSLDDTKFIFALFGEIFVVQDDFQVARPANGYAAIGAGANFALGAFHALTAPDVNLGHQDPVELAMQAASVFSASVLPPFTYETMRYEEPTREEKGRPEPPKFGESETS